MTATVSTNARLRALGTVAPAAATVARLPLYLRALAQPSGLLPETVSSAQLAASVGVTPAQVRRDLACLGFPGTRGVGYRAAPLRTAIHEALGLAEQRSVVIVGAGNLGQALAGYAGFSARGFDVVGLLDSDPGRIGLRVGPLTVEPVAALAEVVRDRRVSIGVVATPAAAAQDVVSALAAAGVRSVLSFAAADLAVPDGVDVRTVDLSTELAILSFHAARHPAVTR